MDEGLLTSMAGDKVVDVLIGHYDRHRPQSAAPALPGLPHPLCRRTHAARFPFT
jgi:hypothetical protein